ncbi:hypothetical protein GJAV_G00253260 [Gymnothorax javanicus]|nr:hypothetical protein GJAV_G00253260 [Gymnothorax javanicus]
MSVVCSLSVTRVRTMTNSARKKEEKKKKKDEHDYTNKKGRFLIQDTKKLDCPAKIHLSHTLLFPDFKDSSGLQNCIDTKVEKKIEELIKGGVASTWEMQQHLNAFVNEIFAAEDLDSISNVDRRFYPSKVDLKNRLYRAVMSSKHSKIDQVNVEHLVNDWKRDRPDNFFLR